MKREVKIGLFAVVMIAAAWAGIRFLSGIDIFSRNVEYYAAYDQVDGIQSASPIMLKGVKIGTVTSMSFDPALNDKVVLCFSIKHQYHIPTNSDANIFSNGLMGAKAIEITYGDATTYLQKGDTLRSSRDRDLMDVAGSELDFFKQKFSQITNDLSQTLGNINVLLEGNTQNVTEMMAHLNAITGDLQGLITSQRGNIEGAVEDLSRFTSMLGNNAVRMDSIIGNVNRLMGDFADERIAHNLNASVLELNTLMAKINTGDGTVGKLMNDPQLYQSLTQTSDNLALLLANLQQHPGRYVHFSLFGRSPEKMQAKAEKQAAKAAEKVERDSLKRLK